MVVEQKPDDEVLVEETSREGRIASGRPAPCQPQRHFGTYTPMLSSCRGKLLARGYPNLHDMGGARRWIAMGAEPIGENAMINNNLSGPTAPVLDYLTANDTTCGPYL